MKTTNITTCPCSPNNQIGYISLEIIRIVFINPIPVQDIKINISLLPQLEQVIYREPIKVKEAISKQKYLKL